MATEIMKNNGSTLKLEKKGQTYIDKKTGQLVIETKEITPVSKLKEKLPGASKEDILNLYKANKLHFYTIHKNIVINGKNVSFLSSYKIENEKFEYEEFVCRNDICVITRKLYLIKAIYKDLRSEIVHPFGENDRNNVSRSEIENLKTENKKLKIEINEARNTILALENQSGNKESIIAGVYTKKRKSWREKYPVCALIADLHEEGKERNEIVQELMKTGMTKLQIGGLTNPTVGYLSDESVKKRVSRDAKKKVPSGTEENVL